jgi:hypothetical protein
MTTSIGVDNLFAKFRAMTHRHRRRGSYYRKLGVAEVQCSQPIKEGDPLVVYAGEDGKLWARPQAEFEDGRFEELK